MNADPRLLDLRVHLADGSSYAFQQPDPEACRKSLERFEPHKLFAQPYFSIEGADRVTLFPSSRITHLDLSLDPDPGWSMIGRDPETNIQEISGADFKSILGSAAGAGLTRRARTPGEEFYGFVLFLLAGHAELILELHTRVAIVPEQKRMLEWLTGKNTLFFPRAAGGYVFINPAQILRLDILPGQPSIAPLAWRAEPAPASAGD